MDINMKQIRLDIRLVFLLLAMFVMYFITLNVRVKTYPFIMRTTQDTIIVIKTIK